MASGIWAASARFLGPLKAASRLSGPRPGTGLIARTPFSWADLEEDDEYPHQYAGRLYHGCSTTWLRGIETVPGRSGKPHDTGPGPDGSSVARNGKRKFFSFVNLRLIAVNWMKFPQFVGFVFALFAL